jgi:hypothetical protein
MASTGERGWRNERWRAVLAHTLGFFGANLVCGTLTQLLLRVSGSALGWAPPASLEISALALGAACVLAGAALLMSRRAPAGRRDHGPLARRIRG